MLSHFLLKIQESIAEQLKTLIYGVPVMLGAGIAIYFSLPFEPQLWAGPMVALACLGLAVACYRGLDLGRARNLTLYIVLLALFWGGVGFSAAAIRAVLVKTPLLVEEIGPLGIKGRIASLEQLESGKGVRIVLNRVRIRNLPPDQRPYSIRLSIRKGFEPLKTGQIISVFAKVEPPSPPSTPGGFDFRRHAYFKKIGGYGYVLGSPRIFEQPTTNWQNLFENGRNVIAEKVSRALPAPQASIVTALLTGERAAIAKEDWDALRNSGLAHLLAISGANVDMVAIIVFFLTRLVMAAIPGLALYHPIKKYAAVLSFVAAFAYVLLILPSIPTLRALLMVSIVLLAVLLDRSPISLRLVCVGAALILMAMPEQLLAPSFQLSFAAVTALVAVFEWIGPWVKNVHRDAGFLKRFLIYVVGVCFTTIIATLATAPISLYHFQNLAVYGVLANALAVPLMTFIIMPLALISYFLMMIGIEGPVLMVMGRTSDWVLDIAHWTAALPGAVWTPPAMPLSAMMMIITAGLILCLTARVLKAAAVLPLVACAIILITHQQPDMMVSAGGKLVMIRDGQTVWINSLRAERRLKEDWLQYWGMPKDALRKMDGTEPIFLLPKDVQTITAIWRKGNYSLPVYQPHDRLWEAMRTPDTP